MSGKPNGKKARRTQGLARSVIAKLGRPLIKHLSDLARESLRQAGSWKCLEIVYQNEPKKILDYFFLNSRSAKGARNRLCVFKEQIHRHIEKYGEVHNPVRLMSLGSGPGHEILDSIKKLKGTVTVKATCIDQDPLAIEHGKLLADEKDVSTCVEYVLGNVLRLNLESARYDIALLSGLVDYFEDDTAVSVLTNVREQLFEGGAVLIANMRRHYLASTMRVLGNWNLIYREPEDVEQVLKASGYKQVETWLEPERIFCIAKGVKLS